MSAITVELTRPIERTSTHALTRLRQDHLEQMQRLATQASRAGLSIVPEPSGRFQVRDPLVPYIVQLATPWSCTCRHHEVFKRCIHVAAVRQHLGLLGGE
jgi:hypothetical protein